MLSCGIRHNIMTDANSFTDLLKGMIQLVNEANGDVPMGAFSKGKDGFAYAKSVLDMPNLDVNIIAKDGFIKDGLAVRLKENIRVETPKFHGWRAVFEFTGSYNGLVTVFCRTEMEHKMYLNHTMWKVRDVLIVYKALDPSQDKDFERVYKEPLMMEKDSGEWVVKDRKTSVESKVHYAMKAKFQNTHDAYCGDLVLNMSTGRFEDPATIV